MNRAATLISIPILLAVNRVIVVIIEKLKLAGANKKGE